MENHNETCGGTGGPDNVDSFGSITIVKGYKKDFFVNLFYTDILSPFDLTGATEVIIALPAATGGSPIEAKMSLSQVSVIGSPGAGYLQVHLTTTMTNLLLTNPYAQQFQDLQVAITNADTTVSVFVLQGVLNIIDPPYGVLI